MLLEYKPERSLLPAIAARAVAPQEAPRGAVVDAETMQAMIAKGLAGDAAAAAWLDRVDPEWRTTATVAVVDGAQAKT